MNTTASTGTSTGSSTRASTNTNAIANNKNNRFVLYASSGITYLLCNAHVGEV